MAGLDAAESHEKRSSNPEPDTAQKGNAANGDDTYRYIEHLQKQLIEDGWEEFFLDESIPNKGQFESIIQMVAPTLGEVDQQVLDMAREMWAAPIERNTVFENRLTELRYRPILREIIEAADDLELPPVRPIDLVTSTDISCTPLARPTEDRHLLFAGEGTARFCNFWTKAISRVFFTLKELPAGLSEEEWNRAIILAKPSGIVLAVMLAIKYALEGTMLQFYRVPNIPEETDWRAALLHAIFLFSMAHEYAHFIAYENHPETRGMLSPEENRKLEFWCDSVAIRISIQVGKKKRLIQTRSGLGALAFYRAVQICHDVKELYIAAGRISQVGATHRHLSSHPALEERVGAIVSQVLLSATSDEREEIGVHIDGCLSMLDMMRELTVALVKKTIALRVSTES